MDALDLAWKRYAEACCTHCAEAGRRALAEIPAQRTQEPVRATVSPPRGPDPA